MKHSKRKTLVLSMLLVVLILVSMFPAAAFAAGGNVAKVGSTEYATIDEAIANWTNGTTLTLLADVTLSDVIKLSSTEMHTLDLGTYTMTAASGKDAIQYVVKGRSSAGYALDIKADATNPGGITATGGSVVRHIKPLSGAPSKDRPITRFYGGIFNASYIVRQGGALGAGYTGASAPHFYFYGGTFNGTIYTNRTLNQFYGGTFNGSLMMSVDSSAYTLIAGGKFKNLSNLFMSSLNSDKFTIGSSKGVYDRDVYVDDNGYYVIAASAPADTDVEAAIAMTPGTNDYFKYSKIASKSAMDYTDVYTALNKNTSAKVTVFVDELDLTDSSFKGTIIIPDENGITVKYSEGTTPAWKVEVDTNLAGKIAVYTEQTDANGVITRKYTIVPLVNYTVNHYKQKDNSTSTDYELAATETLEGGVGASTAAAAKTYTGFTVKAFDQKVIAASGTQIDIYYDINTYTVNYYADGALVETQTVDHGKNAVAPAIPAKEGHDKTAPVWDNNGTNITTDTDINAVYTINEYEVKYIIDGVVVDTQTVKHGEDASAPTIPDKENHDQVAPKWDKESTNIISDTEISAVYTVNTYTVNYYADGVLVETQTVKHGEDAVAPAIPEKEGYNKTAPVWDDEGKNITADRDINAVYTINKYNVTYYVDGVAVGTSTVEHGSNTASAPAIPEKAGYNKISPVWDKDGKNITADTAINAVYTINTYTITYIADGKVVDTVTVEHGADAVLPSVPAKEGFTAAWDNDGAAITSDARISAVYTAIEAEPEETPETDDVPATGEISFVWLWIVLAAISITAISVLIARRKNAA